MQLRLLACALALAACDSGTSGPDFSGVVVDLSSFGDAGDLAIANVYCAQSCQAPEACCIAPTATGGWQAMCAQSCPDGGVFTQCTGPSDCSSQAPNCCFSLALEGNLDASIMSAGGGAMCTADCPAGLSDNNTVFHTRLCHAASDCSGYSGDFGSGNEPFEGCCSSPRAPAVQFCAPTRLAGNDGVTCS
jgi:hypothetical protein